MPDPPPAETGSWTGSWIAEPPSAPEPPVPYGPEPAPPEYVAEPQVEAEAHVAEVVGVTPRSSSPTPRSSRAPNAEVVEADAEVVEPDAEVVEAPTPSPRSPHAEAPVSTGVSTWSSSSARPASASATAFSQKVNFLVVSGAALVVTGFVVARRSGRH